MVAIPRLPRPPIGPDPLRRVPVPKDLAEVTTLAPERDPADVGMSRDAIETIWSAAERLYQSGMHPALQLCLRRRGEVVLDRALGHAKLGGEKATTETPFVIFSASKAVTAVVAHLLDERRLIHLEDRVS
jgi:CubicO group peptidase (beta-lactamase class C family)